MPVYIFSFLFAKKKKNKEEKNLNVKMCQSSVLGVCKHDITVREAICHRQMTQPCALCTNS